MEVTIPYHFVPRPYQRSLYNAMLAGEKRAIHVAHRRAGKDKLCLNIMIAKMMQRVGTYYYLFPTREQASKVMWHGIDRDGFRFLDHFPKEIIRSKNETEKRIILKNGSVFQLGGTDDFDALMGTNPIGVVFSEYALQNPKAWDFIRPILAENGGWAIFDYTPRGMNHGYRLLQQGKENGWFTEVLTVDVTNAIDKETIEQERKEMPRATFLQEYYCDFIEGASAVFKGVDDCVNDEWRITPDHTYTLGVDLAKKEDYTVIAPFDRMTFAIGPLDRFNLIDYNLQKARIEASYFKYHKSQIRLDSTGVGEPIYDDLWNRGLNVDPFRFTEQSRRDLLMNLALLIEQRKITIPHNEILIEELKSFQYTITERGKVRMEAPGHDDTVMAVALAVWNSPDNPLPSREKVKRVHDMLSQFDYYQGNKKGIRRAIRLGVLESDKE